MDVCHNTFRPRSINSQVTYDTQHTSGIQCFSQQVAEVVFIYWIISFVIKSKLFVQLGYFFYLQKSNQNKTVKYNFNKNKVK